VSAIHDHGLLDRDGLRPTASEHAVVQALADFPRCRLDVLQTDAAPSVGVGLNPALLADELDQVGRAARLLHSQLRSVGVPVHLQAQRWLHECSLRRVSVQAAEAAEVEPFGERGRLHDQLGGLGQACREDRQRGLRRLTGVLDCVGQHDELLLRWFVQLIEQQHQPVALAFPAARAAF
jgi:hypothetical protein